MADVPAAETDVVAIGNAIVGLPSHAGEADAGGFLYAPTRGREPATCGRIAGATWAEVVGHFGSRPEIRLADPMKAAPRRPPVAALKPRSRLSNGPPGPPPW